MEAQLEDSALRMWSRGLGRSNLGIDFRKVQVLTVGEALDRMPQQAAELLSKEVATHNVIAVSGKVLPPAGWEFVILFEQRDILTLILKLLFNRRITKLVLGDSDVRKRILTRENKALEKSAS